MHHATLFFLTLATLSHAATSADWITETPLEFIATGRFQTPSDGSDLLVVDKASGLARLGLQTPSGRQWIEQPTGLSAITGLTTLRNGSQDVLAVSSRQWNAIQLVAIGAEPQTLTSPVIGPQRLVRLVTGHSAGSIVEDVVALGSDGTEPDREEIGGMTEAGGTLFTVAMPDLPVQAQCLSLETGVGVPVLVSVRAEVLRVDRLNRLGWVVDGFEVSGPHPAGLHWTAGPEEIFSMARDSLTLAQHRVSSSLVSPGFSAPSSISLTTPHALPEAVASLDAVPFTDPAHPALRCLVAIRFSAMPEVVHLYRFLDAPVPSAEELTTLYMPLGESFAGLVSLGDDFLLLSGPGGRVKSWRRYAQPAPGELPEVVESGSLPELRARAASPNIFIFNQDPFLTENARLTASQSRLDWTTLTALISQGETDAGSANGLGMAQPISVTAVGGVPIGNQLLPSASVAGLGPVAALARGTVRFQPVPGAYSALVNGQTFSITLRASSSDEQIFYRLPGGTGWSSYDPASPPALTATGSVQAYAVHAVTGARSPLATGAYVFAALPPASPAAATDADSNGLSDAWERAFGITDPNSDTDGDGFNAITEQNYGSDPLDAGSRPPGGSAPEADIAVAEVVAGQITLAWPEGLVGYILETSLDLSQWTPVSPQPMDNAWSDPIVGDRKFYRLRKL